MTEETIMCPSGWRWSSRRGTWLVIASLILGSCQQVLAQDVMRGSGPGRRGGNCRPVSDRDNEHNQDAGCWIMARVPQGEMSQGTVFWHVYRYPNRPEAEAVKGRRGTIIEGLGEIWLFAI